VDSLILKPGREKSLLRRHPWIFSGAVERVEGGPASGATVDLLSSGGEFLARAAYSPASQIRARAWTFNPAEQVDADFFRRRIRSALQARAAWGLSLALPQGDGLGVREYSDDYRLIHAESDGLPGLVVDRYGKTLAMQCLTAGAEFWRESIADILLDETGLSDLFERSDADVRELEGLGARVGPLRGNPPQRLTILECGSRFVVDLAHGHKTGFYLDQRENRRRVRELAQGREVLDCFCYTGAFTVNALKGGASSILAVDSSADSLALARENLALNDLPAEAVTFAEGDVFQVLRRLRDEARLFDLIVLDPPKFAATAAQAERAARGYKDINLLAFKLLRPGGLLVTFSCSGGVDAALFQKIVAGAALDAGVEAQILEHLSQAADHPVSLHFPEGAYLKGLVCYKVG